MKWPEVRKLHSDVAAKIEAAVENVPPARWLAPRAEGKWSPAEIAEHLILSYDVVLGELDGGPGMKIVTPWYLRVLWSFTAKPRLLAGAPFPKGVRAPRELRPSSTRAQSEAVAALRDRAAKLDAVVHAAIGTNKKVSHAYLGRMPLAEGALFFTRHLQNHLKQFD